MAFYRRCIGRQDQIFGHDQKIKCLLGKLLTRVNVMILVSLVRYFSALNMCFLLYFIILFKNCVAKYVFLCMSLHLNLNQTSFIMSHISLNVAHHFFRFRSIFNYFIFRRYPNRWEQTWERCGYRSFIPGR